MAKTKEQREREERIARAAQNIAAGIGPIKLNKIENKKNEGGSSGTIPLKKVDVTDKNWAIKDQDSAFKRVASALAPKLSLDTKSKPTNIAQMDKMSLARATRDFSKNKGMTTKQVIDKYSGNPYAGIEFTPAGERLLVDSKFGNYVTKPIMSGAYNTERNIAIGRSVNIGRPNNDSEAVRAYNQLLEKYAPERSGHAVGRAVQSAGQLVGQQLNYNANPLAGTPLRGVGTTARMYESMVGDVYDSLASAGVSKERASDYAQSMGIVLAGLEKAQLDEVMKGFKVLNKAGSTGVIKDLSALSGMEKALGAKTTRMLVDALAPATGRYLKGIAKETGEEILQETVQIAGENLAKHQEGIQKDSWGEMGTRLKDTAVQSAGAFAVMGLPSLGVNMGRPDGGYNYTEQIKTGKADVMGALDAENQRLGRTSDVAMQTPRQDGKIQARGGSAPMTDTRVHKDSKGFYLADENAPRTPVNERRVMDLGKKLGVQIEFADYDDSRIQGQWNGQRLFISRTANKPLTTVLMHELTHSVENTGFYGDLANDIILNNYRDNWSDVVGQKQAQLEQAGQRFDVDYAQKEIIAEHFQDLFGNEQAVQALVRQNGSLGQRIYQWLGDLIQKIGATDEAKLLIDARRQFGEALAYNKERRFASQEMQKLLPNEVGAEVQPANQVQMDRELTEQKIPIQEAVLEPEKPIQVDQVLEEAPKQEGLKEEPKKARELSESQRKNIQILSKKSALNTARELRNRFQSNYLQKYLAEDIERLYKIDLEDMDGLQKEIDTITDYVNTEIGSTDYSAEEASRLQNYMKKHPVNISAIKDSITDYSHWHKEYFSKIRTSNKSTTTMDVYYAELLNAFPGMLDPNLETPLDQLREIQRVIDRGTEKKKVGGNEDALYDIESELYKSYFSYKAQESGLVGDAQYMMDMGQSPSSVRRSSDMTYGEFYNKIKEAVVENQDNYEAIGVRFENANREIGDTVNNSKHNEFRADERDFPVFGSQEYEDAMELDGASTWGVYDKYNDYAEDINPGEVDALKPGVRKTIDDKMSGWDTDNAYVIGGEIGDAPSDSDYGEVVIRNPVVLAKLFQNKPQENGPNIQNMMDMDGELFRERGKVSRLGQRTADSDMYNLIGDSLQDRIDRGQLDYTAIGDAPEVERAKTRLKRDSADKLAHEFITKSDGNERLTKSDAVTAIGTVQALINEGKLDLAEDMITSLSLSATEAGQFIQSLHLLTALTPEGKVKQANKMISRLEQQRIGKKKFDQGDMDFVSKERREDILRQTTPEGAAQAQKRAVIEYVQNTDPTLWEKADAWRYLAMLGNPRTHMRNIAGNLLFKLPRGVGKGIAGAAQDIIGNRNTDEFRTRTLKPSSTKQKQAAKAYFEVAQSLMDNAHPDRQALELKMQNQKLLPGVLNSLANFNTNALEAEDVFFMKSEFVSTFANYLQANQIDPSTIVDFGQNIDGKQIARPKVDLDPRAEKIVQNGIDYAVQQAKEATFREYNSWASSLNKIRTGGGPVRRLAMDAVFPFTTTPLNIAKQGAVVYSPLGLAQGVRQLYNKAQGGDIRTSDIIDTFAKGLSGSAIVGVGYVLAQAGLLTGGDPEDRKEKALAGLEGEQVYAIDFGDFTYTLDWMAPASMPLFLGVELYRAVQEDQGANWGNITDSLSTISDPMIQMSVFQGLNNFVSGFQRGGLTDAIGNTGKELAIGYTGQYMPTLMGQVARTMDDTRRTKYWDKNSTMPEVAKSMINNARAKTPVWAESAPAWIDSFGETQSTGSSAMSRAIQNMLSPGFINKKSDDKSIEELRRLYDATAEKTVIPGASVRYLSVDGENVHFTPKQYEEWNVLNGRLRKEAVDGLFASRSYQLADERSKVNMVEKAYKYATERAKEEMFQVDPDAWVKNVDGRNVGRSIAQMVAENDFKERAKVAKKEGDTRFLLKNSPFENLELTGKARTRYIYESLNKTDQKKWDERGLNMDIEDFYKAQIVSKSESDNPFEGLGLQGEDGWNFVLSTMSDSAYARSRHVRRAWPGMAPDFYYEAYRAINGKGTKDDKILRLLEMEFPTSEAYRFWNYHNEKKYQ